LATIQRTARHFLPEVLRSPSTPVLLLISALAVGGAALVPLVQSSIATTTNGHVRQLELERDDWQARIQELELEVATLAGLDRVEQEARTRLKMTAPKETRYLSVPVEAPEPRRLPSRYLPAEARQKEAEPAIWEQVLDWLPLP
jgi:cell division protein FtsL